MEDMKDKEPSQCERNVPPAFSLNNRIVVEPYQKEGLKTTVSNGFAMIQQKVAVKGLKVLMRATVNVQGHFAREVEPGDMVYVKEELLHTQQWAQKVYQSDAVEGEFMIIDMVHVEFVVPK